MKVRGCEGAKVSRVRGCEGARVRRCGGAGACHRSGAAAKVGRGAYRIDVMLRVLSTAAIVALSVSVLASQSAQTPDAVARALQEHYAKVIDFKADFTQVVRDRFIYADKWRGNGIREKAGPDAVELHTEKHTIVSDGVKTYTHYADEPRVYMSDVPADGDTSPFLLFLGQGRHRHADCRAIHREQCEGTGALSSPDLNVIPR